MDILQRAIEARKAFDKGPTVPTATVVMPGRTLALQDLAPQPTPEYGAPKATTATTGKKGRVKAVDPTDPSQIGIITRRVKSGRVYVLGPGAKFDPNAGLSKPSALALANYLELLGNPIDGATLQVAADGVEILVFRPGK